MSETDLLSRMLVNAPRRHPSPGPVYRLLLVMDTDIPASELQRAVRSRIRGRAYELAVIAPAIAPPLRFLGDDGRPEQANAQRRIQRVIDVLALADIHASSVVGADDPLQAIGDLLAWFQADEIVVVAVDTRRRSWLESGLEQKARDLFGIPVSRLLVAGNDRLRTAPLGHTGPRPPALPTAKSKAPVI